MDRRLRARRCSRSAAGACARPEGEQAEALSRIAGDARSGVVTLLTATKVPEISEAVVIKSVIEDLN